MVQEELRIAVALICGLHQPVLRRILILSYFFPLEVQLAEDSLADFLRTEFYRGLALGNAPRQCHNCGRYFLLTAGYNTCYCNNIAPGELERTCRKVGAHRKEALGKANRTPARKEYDRTYNRLKVRKQRGKISVGVRLPHQRPFHAETASHD